MFARLSERFGPFNLDVCATEQNAKCALYFTKEQDALGRAWAGKCWMNPPYGRQLGKWIEKAHDAADAGATVVCLLPARTDTRWFHDHCLYGAKEIVFLRGRVKFSGAANGAPFPSMVVIFRPGPHGPAEASGG